ncbi:MAG: ATP-dependent DNA ligase [Phycisphaerales bacterium]
MRRFCALYERLDATTRSSEKVAALAAYFGEADAGDAAWALALFLGRRLKRGVSHTLMRDAAAEAAGIERWLLDACHERVGDLSETIALLVPADFGGATPEGTDEALHEVIERRIRPLASLDERGKRAALRDAWSAMNPWQRFVFHKLLGGALRVGVQRGMLIRALARVAEVDEPTMAHRLSGLWSPDAEGYERLLRGGSMGEAEATRPYPFYLASPLDGEAEALGDASGWLAEWKWDGIRAQLIRRGDRVLVWTRGDELVTPAFPEIAAAASRLPDGTVLDGELLAWERGRPMPFSALQKRLNRKRYEPMLFPEVPVAFVAYDLLEHAGRDVRTEPLERRRALLAEVVRDRGAGDGTILLSESHDAEDWESLAALRARSRGEGTEGLMLKRCGSAYGTGRTRGDWWKWKVEPYSIDAVLVMAERGHGRRASLFTDFTFAVWDLDELVPIAKAYSGLTDEEFERIDAWIRRHTRERFGPARRVEPEHVFELHFEGLRASDRHKSGIALRFPRMHRWRTDKRIDEADTIERVRALLDGGETGGSGAG